MLLVSNDLKAKSYRVRFQIENYCFVVSSATPQHGTVRAYTHLTYQDFNSINLKIYHLNILCVYGYETMLNINKLDLSTTTNVICSLGDTSVDGDNLILSARGISVSDAINYNL